MHDHNKITSSKNNVNFPSIGSNQHDLLLRSVLVKLLQGFVFNEEKKYWDKLLLNQEYVRNYFSSLNLFLHLNQEDGYAFLKSTPSTSDKFADGTSGDAGIDSSLEDSSDDYSNEGPRPAGSAGERGIRGKDGGISLIRKMQLSFDVSILLVLMREALEQFDEKVSDDYRLILSKIDIYEMLKGFYPDKTDETQLIKRFDSLIAKVSEMGFLKELKNNSGHFEVRRVLKAFFDASKLKEIKENMRLSLVNKGSNVWSTTRP
ncbi:MAG: DUF4194 domain-containing protein [Oligoflexia bacterium]|nr:DUF4194 domain-containing protein [Oligoflexia bacterium]